MRGADQVLRDDVGLLPGFLFVELDLAVRDSASLLSLLHPLFTLPASHLPPFVFHTDTFHLSSYESERMYDPIAATCGLLQTIINFYFIYVYFQKYPNFEDIEREPGQRVPAIVVPLESEIPEIVVTEPVKGGAAAEAAEAREAVSAVGRGDVFVLEAAEEGRIVD